MTESFWRFALGSVVSSTSMPTVSTAGLSISNGVAGPGRPRLGAGCPASSVASGTCAWSSTLGIAATDSVGLPPFGSLTTALAGGGLIPTAGWRGTKSGIGVGGTVSSSTSSNGSSPISSSNGGTAMPPVAVEPRKVGTILLPMVPSSCHGNTSTCR